MKISNGKTIYDKEYNISNKSVIIYERAYADEGKPILPFYASFQASAVSTSMHFVQGYIRKPYDSVSGNLSVVFTYGEETYQNLLNFSIENSHIKVSCTHTTGIASITFL